MSFAVGSLVQARGREWVVLPESTADLLVLRPLGGTDEEIAGIYLPLEGADVRPAAFDLPDPTRPGDYRSCRLLRDAVRLGFRSSAGPFRSFARIAVEPRPYQLVPLLMALKLDPVRLLIADDVGIGKTIEALLIARELLDRGEVQRLAVLCPPHLAEQWQAELRDKFHIEAELVLPSTVAPPGAQRRAWASRSSSVYPFVIVSTDFIKSDRRRDEFLRTCPELVIVDEAHTCAFSAETRGGRHQRHQLLQDPGRRRPTATSSWSPRPRTAARRTRSARCLGLLRPDFADLPDDLSGRPNEKRRREVAAHLVQRRRADIRAYLGADTVFPEREEAEETYSLAPEYKKLFERVLAYARERVQDTTGGGHRQRVRWWSALALLRSLASSPAAAAATLRTRSITAGADDADEADALGRRAVLDLDERRRRRNAGRGARRDWTRLRRGRRRQTHASLDPASACCASRAAPTRSRGPEQDAKLAKATAHRRGSCSSDGFNPIVFCRFIPTAEYVAEAAARGAAQRRRGRGRHRARCRRPSAKRASPSLGAQPSRVLVATDCLSEGHQPAGALRRGGPLRPVLEPDPPRAARGPRRPLRPAEAARCAR